MPVSSSMGNLVGKRRAKGVGQRQLALSFPSGWGGPRRGAGRKRGPRSKVWHRARPAHAAAEPVHVTLRARVAPLRSQHLFPTVRLALIRAGQRDHERFRILHYSVQRDHVHLIVEASDKRALSTGVQSIAIRVARYVNDLLGRRGPLWADRWHGHALKTPREVRNALAYVLANFKKHARGPFGGHLRVEAVPPGIDPYSSGEWFDGWREWQPSSGTPPPFVWHPRDRADTGPEATERVVAKPRSWLAAVGWRRHGLIHLDEKPST
jgi:REP element-mobilizing transposase RayT